MMIKSIFGGALGALLIFALLAGIAVAKTDLEANIGVLAVGTKFGESGTAGCFIVRDSDDAGDTACDALNGSLTCEVDTNGICGDAT